MKTYASSWYLTEGRTRSSKMHFSGFIAFLSPQRKQLEALLPFSLLPDIRLAVNGKADSSHMLCPSDQLHDSFDSQVTWTSSCV
jgi:hypothetical protein